MKRVPVSLGEHSYEVVIGHGILNELGETLRELELGSKEMLVTSPVLWSLYGKTLNDSMEASDFDVSVAIIADDEESKSLQTTASLYDKMVESELDRGSGVVAVGGGVIGDVTGFAAATFMRGIRFVQVPTTLLAQVDSSVGGKTGVNHPKGKNLVGAFHQPALVWADVLTLRTLPDREIRSGLSEVIKYAMISDAELFHVLETTAGSFSKAPIDTVIEIVSRCCSIKARIVEEDEKEHGVRSILNYGHTIGHALESLTSYTYYTHGEAIAVGMIAAARISQEIGITDQSTVSDLERLIISAGLPTRVDRSIDPLAIVHQLDRDKKRLTGRIRWVLPEAKGRVLLTDQVPLEVVLNVLRGMVASKEAL